jgi:flagellar assembly protein FliH
VVTDDAATQLREAGVTLLADPSLSPVDALVESDGSITDLRITEAIERVRQVLA